MGHSALGPSDAEAWPVGSPGGAAVGIVAAGRIQAQQGTAQVEKGCALEEKEEEDS